MRQLHLSLLVALTGCGLGTPETVRIDAQLLQLPGVTDAEYDITVTTADGDVVWSTPGITSSAYGDGEGSITYVGPCDASGDGLNIANLTLVDLPDLDPSSWSNPTANGPLQMPFVCLANEDARVQFDITILRDADLGFVDIGVSLDDIACSAKLDCLGPDGEPMELLQNDQGVRDSTVVLGLACTAGPDADTHLYLDDVVLACPGLPDTVVDVAQAGQSGPRSPALYQAAVYRGVLPPPDADVLYWNVALGLEDGLPDGCVLTTRATASDGAFANGAPAPGSTHPVITWDVPLTGPDGALACTTHPLGGPDSGVEASYPDAVAPFDHGASQGPNGGVLIDGTGAPVDTGDAGDAGDSGDAGDAGDAGPPSSARTIFITPQSYGASFGTRSFAHGECQRWANAAGLAGSYRAWVCTDDTPASSGVSTAGGPFVNTGSSVVASSWSDLVDGDLNVPIRFDPYGNPVPTTARVFTGCRTNGFPTPGPGAGASGTCDDWTATSGGFPPHEALLGHPNLADGRWTDHEFAACDTQHRFICIAQ